MEDTEKTTQTATRQYLVDTIYPLEAAYLALHPNAWHETTPMSLRGDFRIQTINRATSDQLHAYAAKLTAEIKRLSKSGSPPTSVVEPLTSSLHHMGGGREGGLEEGRTSAEVFSTWKTFRANGFTIDTRNRTNSTFICRVCSAELPKGDRLYTNANQSAAIHFYAESCQRHAAPGQTMHHEPIQSIAKISYIRNQPTVGKRIPYAEQPKPQWLMVQDNDWNYLPNLADPLYGENAGVWQRTTTKPITSRRPVVIAGLLPASLPASSHGKNWAEFSLLPQNSSPYRMGGGREGGLLLLPAPTPITLGTLQKIWQTTHMICDGRPEFNAYCKKGYLRTITGRDVFVPEQLSESEGQLVIDQIRKDSLQIAPSMIRGALDLIGKAVMGHNNWACVNAEVLSRTGGRTTLFTRLYINEVLTWRKELEVQLTATQLADVHTKLYGMRQAALASALA